MTKVKKNTMKKNVKTRPPTVSDDKGMGGVIAQDGFDYQIWEALVRLPAWLRDPTFDGFIVEGLEDFEARFFAPYTLPEHALERFQAKAGTLSKAGISEVLSSFQTYADHYPNTARLQTLVTPALPSALQWVARDGRRLRRALPFYRPFNSVTAESDAKYLSDLEAEFGAVLGAFTARNVSVELRTFTDADSARVAFAHALETAFPDLDASPKKTRAAFDALVTLATQKRGMMITRADALSTLRTALDARILEDDLLVLHVRSDRDPERVDALEIDATPFAGGASGFPEPERWQRDLVLPLTRVATWAHGRGHQRVRLSGSFRLSTAFALGVAFRAARGFELEIPCQSDTWMTAGHAPLDATTLGWQVKKTSGVHQGRLVVAVGVIRNPMQHVMAHRSMQDDQLVLHLQLDGPVTDGREAQAAVALIKREVDQAVGLYRATTVDLYFVGPAALALALGHRWNALPRTQWHEFDREKQRYVPTVEA